MLAMRRAMWSRKLSERSPMNSFRVTWRTRSVEDMSNSERERGVRDLFSTSPGSFLILRESRLRTARPFGLGPRFFMGAPFLQSFTAFSEIAARELTDLRRRAASARCFLSSTFIAKFSAKAAGIGVGES